MIVIQLTVRKKKAHTKCKETKKRTKQEEEEKLIYNIFNIYKQRLIS